MFSMAADYIYYDYVYDPEDSTLAGKPKTWTALPYAWNLTAINVPEAWEKYATGNANIHVAVFDTGIDPENPDLKNAVSPLMQKFYQR